MRAMVSASPKMAAKEPKRGPWRLAEQHLVERRNQARSGSKPPALPAS